MKVRVDPLTGLPIIQQDSVVHVGGGGGGTSLPDQTGNSGKYLKTDGSTTSWATVSGGGGGVNSVVAGTNVTVDATDPANPIVSATGGGGSGTVTSVAQTVPTGFTVSGSPVTTTGTLALGYDTGYQGYTTTEAGKLSGIASGANVGVVPNGAITGATKTKITYDAKGLVTAGADATTADIADSTNKRYVTDANLTVIGNTSGTNTGDQTSVSGNAGTVTNGVYTTDTGTVTNTMLAGSIASSKLANTAVANLSGTNTGDQDLSSYATTSAVAAAYQPLDSDLTTIAGLTATTDNFMVGTASAWASRTPSQARTQLGLGTLATQSGTFSGTSSGTNTGDQTTITGNAGTATTLATGRTIGTITGDATSAGSSFNGSANNTNALTLATVNSNVGSFTNASMTVNAKGLITAASSATTTGTGNTVLATSPTLVTPALGTPSALVGTNITGTGASFTAGTATVANGLKSATTTVAVSSATAPSSGQVLTATSSTAATWQTPSGGGSGDVVGPGSAVDNTLAVYDGTTGKLLKDSGGSASDALIYGGTSKGSLQPKQPASGNGHNFRLLASDAGDTTSIGGYAYLTAGNGGSTSGNGGQISIHGGSGSVSTGGHVNLYGGSSTSGTGGSVYIYGGSTTSGTAGNVVIGNPGTVAIQKNATAFNMTLDVSALTASRTISFQDSSDTVVGRATTDTLTNKDLTSGTNTFPTFNQSTTGSAATLTTSRTFQTNLASTSTASFNGSANVTPGVTGTLAVGNGGTGATSLASASIATYTGSETLTNKTLTSPVLNTGVSGTAVLDEDNMASDSASKLATQQSIKAYVDAAVAAAKVAMQIPIGDVHISTVSTNPATTLGYGTWIAESEGYAIVGKKSSGTFSTAGATVGAETHTLTTAEMPSHSHATINSSTSGFDGNILAGGSGGTNATLQNAGGAWRFYGAPSTGTAGSGGAHNNIQPSKVFYVWKRTA